MRRILTIVAAATLLSLTWATAAHASTGPGGQTQITLSAGLLTVSGGVPGNFPNTPLTGVDQTVNANLGAMNVTDATGASTGWHVTASTGTKSLCNGSACLGALNITGPSGACTTGDTCDGTTITPESGELDTTASVTIDSASSPAGGSFDFPMKTSALSLVIPGNATLGASPYTFSATLTLTVSPGVS